MYSDSNNRWYPVVDGNHRLAAAIVLKMETIRITPEGDIDYMMEALKPSLIEYV
jgi:ParB-like chromosome segregation protein Spo0J